MDKKKVIFALIILIVIIISVVIIKQKIFSNNTNTDNYITKEAKIKRQTILKELTSSAEIVSGLTEQVELHATYYFEEVYIEINTYIEEGTKILKYTNGTYLTAPYNCVITKFNLPKKGEQCKNSHYVEVQATDTLSMTISITESEMEYVSLGKEVEVVINAFPDTKYKGVITNIDESGTYKQGASTSFSATITFMNDGNIKLGMSSSCVILLQKSENILVAPVEAIEIRNNIKYATIKNDDGITKEVEVQTGVANANYVEIKNGLSDGDIVQYKVIAEEVL